MLKVLLTGASGFLGREIFNCLSSSEVYTLGRSKNSTIVCDLSKSEVNLPPVELVIHSAGMAHVIPKTKEESQAFFKVNTEGTNRLLKSLEYSGSLPRSFVFISSVAVYGTIRGILINEDHALLANDPYGLSKVKAEEMISEWCAKNNVICTILRLPLIAGVNPPGNLAAMVGGIKKGYYFNISGGKSRKSVVLAKDVASVILKIAKIGGVYNLTDREHPSFSEISQYIAKQLGKSKPLSIPGWCATLMAKVGDIIGTRSPINSNKLKKITSDLTFDDQKAVEAFGWTPTPVLKSFKIK